MAIPYAKDPAVKRRAEERARELLRTTAGDEALEMYERLGFLGVRSLVTVSVPPNRPRRDGRQP